jgi:hypothetical protein
MCRTAFVVAVAIASAMVGQSFATTRASDVVINACVGPTGAVSIPPSGACGPHDSALSWNQQGPPGPVSPAPPPPPPPDGVPTIHLATAFDPPKLRSGFTRSLALAGDGTTHLLDATVTVHVNPAKWNLTRRVVCRLTAPSGPTLDRDVRVVPRHGAPATYDVTLTAIVEVGASAIPPSSPPGNVRFGCDTAPRDFGAGESVPGYSHVVFTDTVVVLPKG